MMVLMSGKCSSSRKRLLTVRKRTLVWAFARVNSAMSSERAGIAEGLDVEISNFCLNDVFLIEIPWCNARTYVASHQYGHEHGRSKRIFV